MKKGLLIMMAAFMVAIGANAQAKIKSADYKAVPEAVKMVNAKVTPTTTAIKNVKPVSKRASAVAGEYIMNSNNWEHDFIESKMFTITESEGSIQLPEFEEGATPETFNYNVVLQGFAGIDLPIYGLYNAEESYIYIPVQTVGNSKTDFGTSEDYGDVVFSAVATVDGTPDNYGFDMYLIVNEDGSIEIDPSDLSEAIEAGYASEDAEITGYYNFLPDIPVEEGNAWNYGFDCELFVPNATMSFYTTGRSMGGNGTSWTRVAKRVHVEDYGDGKSGEFVVSNFVGKCYVSVTYNEDGSCLMPFPQDFDEYDYEKYDDSYPFGRLQFRGVKEDEEGYLDIDYESQGLKGYLITEENTKVIEFYRTEYREAWTDESGEHEAGDYIIQEMAKYFCVATDAPTSDQAYFGGYCCNAYILFDSEEPSGINDVKSSTKNNAGTTFNLMGQQVSKSAKGLLIRDGKKFIVK